ncbi:MAG TPA: MogA/MoaB family molybdenum cofactor biosynthesis protein [Terracidiphilus sp.]|nr:MogA/MoaB family molybdenum cofactor biosynthesis protein [Terracidiphilus sp.]
MSQIRAAILTLSDQGYQGKRADQSGPALASWLCAHSVDVVCTKLLPDEVEVISAQLKQWADAGDCDLILTTGGTGVSPRDVTPEATKQVLDREIPGLAEAMRAQSLAKTPQAMLSRAVAGVRGRVLIVNLPGSPNGAIENVQAIWPAIPHAIQKIQGDMSDCAPVESPAAAFTANPQKG